MAEVVLLRIDDRLLHGQIGKSWVKESGANLIVVANDDVKKDRKAQKLMNIARPLYADTVYLSLDELVEKVENDYLDKNTLILVASPKDCYKLIKSGLNIESVNLGNMRNLSNKVKISDNIYLSEEDKNYLKMIKNENISLDIRVLSQDEPIKEEEIF